MPRPQAPRYSHSSIISLLERVVGGSQYEECDGLSKYLPPAARLSLPEVRGFVPPPRGGFTFSSIAIVSATSPSGNYPDSSRRSGQSANRCDHNRGQFEPQDTQGYLLTAPGSTSEPASPAATLFVHKTELEAWC